MNTVEIEGLCKQQSNTEINQGNYASDVQTFFDYINNKSPNNTMTHVRFIGEKDLGDYNSAVQQFYDFAHKNMNHIIKDCPSDSSHSEESVEPVEPEPDPGPHPGPEPDPEPEESDIESCEIQNQVCKIKFKQEIEAINFYKGEDIKNVNHQNEGNKNYTLLMYNKENPFENIEIDRIDYKIKTADPKKYRYENCTNLENRKIIFIDCGIDNTFIHFNFKKIENPHNFYVRFYSQNDEIIYESSKLNNIDNNSENTILKLEKNIEIRNDEIVKFEILIIDSNEYKLETGELIHSGCIKTLNTLSNRVTEVEILQKLKNISFKYFQQDYSESKLLDGLSEVTCEVFLDKDLIICLKNQDKEDRLNKPELYDLVFKNSYYFSLKLLTNNSQDKSLVSFNNGKNNKIITSFSELKISKDTIKQPSTNITLNLQICKRKAEEEEILHTIEKIPKLYFTKDILDRIDEGDENEEEQPVRIENITVKTFKQTVQDTDADIEIENKDDAYKLINKNEVKIQLKSIPNIDNFNEYSVLVSGGQEENLEFNKSSGLITLKNNLIQTKTEEFAIVVSKKINEGEFQEKLRIVILPADSKKISIKKFKQGSEEIHPIQGTNQYKLNNNTGVVSIELNKGELGVLTYHLNGEQKDIESNIITIDSNTIENPPNDLSIVIKSSLPEIDNLEITIIPFRRPGPARPSSPVGEGPQLLEGNKILVQTFKQTNENGNIEIENKDDVYQLQNQNEVKIQLKSEPRIQNFSNFKIIDGISQDISQDTFTKESGLITLNDDFIKAKSNKFSIFVMENAENPIQKLEIVIIPYGNTIQKIEVEEFKQGGQLISPALETNTYKLSNNDDSVEIKLKPERLIGLNYSLGGEYQGDIENNIIKLKSEFIQNQIAEFTINIRDAHGNTLVITIIPKGSSPQTPGPHPPGPAEEEIDDILIDMNEEEEKVKLDGYDDEEFKIYCHVDVIEGDFKIFIENLQYYYTDMIYDRDVMKNYYDIMNYLICLFKYLKNSGNMDINFDTGDEPLTKLFQSERNILDQSCNDTKFKAEPVKDILKIDLIDNLRMGINSLLVNTYQKDMRFLFQDLFYFFIKKISSNSPNSQELIKDDEDQKIFKINLKKLTIKLIHDYFYSEISDDYLLQNNNTRLDDNNTELDDIDKSYEDVIQKIKECQVLKIIHLFEDYKEELKSQKDKVIEKLQGKEDVFSYFGFFD